MLKNTIVKFLSLFVAISTVVCCTQSADIIKATAATTTTTVSSTSSNKTESSTTSSKTSSTSTAKKVKKRVIPAFSTMEKKLKKYSNKNRGHGWLGAEKTQKYFSKFGALTVGNTKSKNVYLTFDEGYEYKTNTTKILNTLKKKKVKAVFFVTMDFVKRNPKLVKRMIKEGHVVGNHSTNHPVFPNISTKKAYTEIKTLHDYVYKHFNYNMYLFRFPEGAHSDRMLKLTQLMGYKAVFWNFAQKDWDPKNQLSKKTTKTNVLKYTKKGTLYLLHAVSPTNVAVLPDVIDSIKKKGYKFAVIK